MSFLFGPIKKPLFLYLFLLNFISNYGIHVYLSDGKSICYMGMLAALMAYVEVSMYLLSHVRWLQIIWLSFLVIIHNLLIISDYFLNIHFHMALGQDAIDVLSETNYIEIKNFVNTYLTFSSVTLWIALMLILNYVILKVSLYLSHIRVIRIIMSCCVLIGVGISVICIYNFVVYRDGKSIPQCQTTTRVGYAFYILHQRMQQIVKLQDVCKLTKAECTLTNSPTVVLVIGESHSVYHSSLYGYEKQTMPCLQKRVNDSILYVFDNVVSTSCGTHKAMLSVFSLDSLGVGFEETPLFPACFKAAGYKSFMYDNQYFVGQGVNFLSNADLSSVLFDERNTERYQYDMDMINKMHVENSPALYVIHLWGQHYTYSERSPTNYRYYNLDDYDKNRWTEEQRGIIAHYDNATRYVDKVLDEIIRRFEDKNCCIVYLSDHGEEIYDLSDFMGHGNAEHSANLDYQIRVPLLIWTSRSYSRPEIVAKLPTLQHIPVTTDDVSHLLIDLAGIQTPSFEPSRSVVNENYNKNKKRIVLNSINYEYYKP